MSGDPVSSNPTLQDIKNAHDGHLPKVPTPPPPPMPDPEPLPPWALKRPLLALWYIASRAGDHGRWTPFRRLTHITRYLYLGGQISLRGWRILEKWGVGALVNMRVEWDDRKLGIQTPHYLWLPTIDGTPSTVEQLARGSKFIHEQAQAGRSIYIHCAAGLGRSPTQVIAYMMTRGSAIDQSIDYVLQRRPFIQLSSKQRQRLEQFAEYIALHKIDYSEDGKADPEEPLSAADVDVPARGKDS